MKETKSPTISKYLFRHNQCLVCGQPLIYKKTPTVVSCYHCGIQNKTQTLCQEGHYVCDECARRDVYEIIISQCNKYSGLNAIELAESIMDLSKIKIHGPEHHLLVPAVMLAIWCNAKNISKEIKSELLNEARNRALKIQDGICATHGACGGSIGVGIFFSLILQVNELDKENYGYINRATANTLANIAKYGGPRCCKRSTYLAILQTRNQLVEDFGLNLPIPNKIQCQYVEKNLECTKSECLFY